MNEGRFFAAGQRHRQRFHFVALQLRDVGGFAKIGRQPIENRLGELTDRAARHGRAKHAEQAGPNNIMFAALPLREEADVKQRMDKPIYGRLRQTGALPDLRQRQAA